MLLKTITSESLIFYRPLRSTTYDKRFPAARQDMILKTITSESLIFYRTFRLTTMTTLHHAATRQDMILKTFTSKSLTFYRTLRSTTIDHVSMNWWAFYYVFKETLARNLCILRSVSKKIYSPWAFANQ